MSKRADTGNGISVAVSSKTVPRNAAGSSADVEA
jgi:hypothetical protein